MGFWSVVKGWFVHGGEVPPGGYLIVGRDRDWTAIYSPDGGMELSVTHCSSPVVALTTLLILQDKVMPRHE